MSKVICGYNQDGAFTVADGTPLPECDKPSTVLLVSVNYDGSAIMHFGCDDPHTELYRDEMAAMPDGVTEYRLIDVDEVAGR